MSFTTNSDGVKLTGAATGAAGQAIEYNFAYLAAKFTAQLLAPGFLTGIWGYWDANLETPLTDGTLMSTLTDQSGHGHHLTGAGASRAAYRTNQFGTHPAFGFTVAANSIMSIAATLPQPTCVLLYGKQTAGGSLFDGYTLNTMRIFSTGNFQQYSNGAASNAPQIRGVPIFVASQYSSSGSFLYVNDQMASCVQNAASTPGGFTLGNAGGAADPSDLMVEWAVVLNQKIDPLEFQRLRRWVQLNRGY